MPDNYGVANPQRVLVTGGAGFIGSALCRAWLARGAHVLAFDDFSADNGRILATESPNLTVVRGTIEAASMVRDVMLTFRPDIVYHLAALHYIPACEGDPVRTLSVNVIGTEAALFAARDTSVAHFVLASSAAVYADSDQPYTESHPTGPLDIYGLSKVFAENLCRRYHSQTNRTTTICRFFNVYGPGDTIPHVIPELLNQFARAHGALRLGSLTPRRDFIAVADVVDALVAITIVPTGGLEVFNVGSGKDHSVQELVDLLGTALGTKLEIMADESRVRRVDRLRLLADINKIKQSTGWKPKTDLLDGLVETIRAHPELEGRIR